jgi:hypothetical protein
MDEEILLTGDPAGGGLFSGDLSFLQTFVEQMGANPILAMYGIVAKGGWIILLVIFFMGAAALWLETRRGAFVKKIRFILLAVDVPRESEQTVKAIDNMFAYVAGAHSDPANFREKWIEGKIQIPLSFEIISIEGHLQYLIRCAEKLRDLVEASIYAQYPTAEITEVEDYTLTVPSEYPNDQTEAFGTEMIPVRSDVYPLKTYVDFEHMLTSEFKDPLSALLESFSRLGPGEQAWYQIIVTPIPQVAFAEKAKKEIVKLTGQKQAVKKNLAEKALDAPIKIMSAAADVAFGTAGAPGERKKEDNPLMSKVFNLTPGERKVVEGVERKRSKIQFKCKIRFVYLARKEVYNKQKILYSFIGAMKQYNTNDMQALKPESKKVGVNSTLFLFKKRRNDRRKEKLTSAYRRRSNWVGVPSFHLGTDELASLWHLPVIKDVKAPRLKKTEAKKSEPPGNLPFA